MGLIDKMTTSKFGLQGRTPVFGIDPTNKLHDTYSVDGKPTVIWKSSNAAAVPQPTKLKKSNDKYSDSYTYSNNAPKI